ncbi:MAG: hypothetical protein II008_21675, partial [Oscillospiraceae bacterium]|nr:hypothetical protein [Oscillospiraceae bacterium]
MSYTLAYTGAEIDALLGKIDAIFVAEYGSTIYSEVTAAIAAGNKVIVANAGKVFVYAGTDDNSGYVFTQSGPNAAKPNATYVTLSTGNVWSTATVDLATLQQFYASLMEDTASGSIASFPDGAENVPVKELSCEIVPVQSGSGDPAPDNVRPISGYTGAEIPVTGKNLAAGGVVAGFYNTSTGEYNYAANYVCSGKIAVKPSSQVYVSYGRATVATFVSLWDINGNYIGIINPVSTNQFTIPSNAYTVAFNMYLSGGTAADFPNFQVEYGTAATTYTEPITPTTYSVSWSDHGTVYKGTAEYKGDGEWEITDLTAFTTLTSASQLEDFNPSTQYGAYARLVGVSNATHNETEANITCSMARGIPYADRLAVQYENVDKAYN